MSKPGAKNPTAGMAKTITTTPNAKLTARGFRIAVATEGTLNVVYRDTPGEICPLLMTTGIHHEPGDIIQAWSDGTLVTNPAATLIAY